MTEARLGDDIRDNFNSPISIDPKYHLRVARDFRLVATNVLAPRRDVRLRPRVVDDTK